MLHKLALATTPETPTLLKEAISPEENMRLKEMYERKAIDMANARGINVPLVEKKVFDPSTGGVKTDFTPSTENLRMSQSTPAEGGVHKKAPALVEKEIQKSHGVVSKSPLKKLRHQTVGKAKRMWGGKGFLGGKWRNRAGVLGGVGALGLGIKAYLDANKTPQPALAPTEPQPQPQMGAQYPSYNELYRGGYPKMGSSKYSPDAVTIPKPTALPKVNPLGPGVGSTPTLKPDGGGGGLLGSSSGGSTSSGQSSGSSTKAAALAKRSDDGVLPLLGLGAGGLGGWALGEKVISPMLQNKEQDILKKMQQQQKTLRNVQTVRKAAPIGAAAAGALLLAALTAMYAKRQERMHVVSPANINPYDQTGAGFAPENQEQWGQFYG